MNLTPVEEHGGYYVKREDLYSVAGVHGGKARSCWVLAQGAIGIVTAGSRFSPQCNIVAHVAAFLGIPARVHTPTGALSPELLQARGIGAEVVQHTPGYNSVIIARAKEDAISRGWSYIPFGMECQAAVEQTSQQVRNIPTGTARLVVPVGSGMSLAGVLHGMEATELCIPVLGVCVGADPIRRLDKWAPPFWRQAVSLVRADEAYHDVAKNCRLGDLELDPIYEAKCLPYLRRGDLLWVVGIRNTARTTHQT